jgi:hypothetical protein
MLNLEEDLDVFFDDFAVDAVLEDGRTIKVLFDDDFLMVQNNVETSVPAARCKTSDIPEIRHEAGIVIHETDYYVYKKQPDKRRGMTLLILSRDRQA